VALRFRRSIKIAPGIRWNFGLKSSSFSFGPRGAKLTVGTRGVHATTGIPGTGLSITQKLSGGRRRRSAQSGAPSVSLFQSAVGCPSCGATQAAAATICDKCHSPMAQAGVLQLHPARACPFCNAAIPTDAYYCTSCNQNLPLPESSPAPSVLPLKIAGLLAIAFVVMAGIWVWVDSSTREAAEASRRRAAEVEAIHAKAQRAAAEAAAASMVLTICEAATRKVGERVSVRAELVSRDDAPGSARVSLGTDERCGQGSGQLVASLVSRGELDKISKAVTKGKRLKTAGTTLVVEGEIVKSEKGRLVHLSKARFRNAGT
jgi:ribosomal protein L40E